MDADCSAVTTPSPEGAIPGKDYDYILVQRFKNGDASSFDEIYARHHDRILSVTFLILKDRADAEEITQDAFIRAHKALPLFRGESSLYTWLYHIACHLSFNRLEYWKRRNKHLHIYLDSCVEDKLTLAEIIPSPDRCPAREAMSKEIDDTIEKCINELRPPLKYILNLTRNHNFSTTEIAKDLGISNVTVRTRLHRAREKLSEIARKALKF